MNPVKKTKQQLIDELAVLQMRVSELEVLEKEAHQAQQDFSERIGRYFPLANHTQEAIYLIFDRKYEYVNDRFAKMFGVTPDDVCHKGVDAANLIAPESRTMVNEIYRKGIRGEFSIQEYEFTGITKEGARIECSTIDLFIPYKWGVAIHGMLRNISMQKRIDEELQRHRSDLQIVLDSVPTSIFYTDREHRFIRANKAFCKSLGFPLKEIIGKSLTDLFPHLPAEQISHFFEVNNQVMNSGHSKRGFVEIFPAVRGKRWIQNDRVPYRDEKGVIVGVICLAIDISELRETEEKLLYLSFHDVLTGLYNRTYFEEELYRLEKGRHFPISIVSVKVNDLIAVNEKEGIAAGNELLKQTAQVIKTFRTEDLVARITGDRFAIVMPSSDRSVGESAVQRLRMTLEAQNKEFHGKPLKLSFGIACGEKGCTLSEVLKEAEAAER
jgi:diguanylate cyclase (GGDEF)-like protein/PAS domain S-box-containing protein